MRLRRRASDDRERAADLLARAGEAARALGMRGVARDCDELAATAGKVVPLRPTG